MDAQAFLLRTGNLPLSSSGKPKEPSSSSSSSSSSGSLRGTQVRETQQELIVCTEVVPCTQEKMIRDQNFCAESDCIQLNHAKRRKKKRTRDSQEESSGSNYKMEMTSEEIDRKWKCWAHFLKTEGVVRNLLREMSPKIKMDLCEGKFADDCHWQKLAKTLETFGVENSNIESAKSICSSLLDMFRCFNVLVENEVCKVNSGGRVEAQQHVWDSIVVYSPKSLFFQNNACSIFDDLRDTFSPFEMTIHHSSSHKRAKSCRTSIHPNWEVGGRVEEKQNVFENICNQIAEAKPTPQRFLIALEELIPWMNTSYLHRESFPFFPKYVKDYWINNLPSSSETRHPVSPQEIGETPPR